MDFMTDQKPSFSTLKHGVGDQATFTIILGIFVGHNSRSLAIYFKNSEATVISHRKI
jgi:hypothetical protein